MKTLRKITVDAVGGTSAVIMFLALLAASPFMLVAFAFFCSLDWAANEEIRIRRARDV